MFVNDYFYKAFIKQTCLVFRFYPVVPLIHFWGVREEANIKTYKKTLRNYLVSDSKETATVHYQSFWQSHVTIVGMQVNITA